VAWEHDPRVIDAWRTGRTGYPVVDAANTPAARAISTTPAASNPTAWKCSWPAASSLALTLPGKGTG